MRHRRTRPTPETPRPRPPARDRRGARLPSLFPKRLRTDAVPLPGLVADGAVAIPARSTATLLAAQVLRDGEAVLLVLRPSLWFILLASLRWIAAGAVLLGVAAAFGSHYRGGMFAPPFRGCAEAGAAIIAVRLMWASLQWMGRLYVLTDLRLLTVSGVLRSDVYDCPLRKVACARLLRSTVDRVLGIGSVEVIPQDPEQPCALWYQVARPDEVHAKVVATLNRAKGVGSGELGVGS
jgi:hypothetical protein